MRTLEILWSYGGSGTFNIELFVGKSIRAKALSEY
jgi:hypothetical protein